MAEIDDDEIGYRADEVVTVKPIKLIHTDFASLLRGPCVRDSIIYALNLGVGATLVRFMMTSNLRRSLLFGLFSGQASFVAFLVGFRYNMVKERTKIYQLEPAFKSYAEIYGTDKDKLKKLEDESVPVNYDR